MLTCNELITLYKQTNILKFLKNTASLECSVI